MPIPLHIEAASLSQFLQNPTFTNYRRLKTELTQAGLTLTQALPDLEAFLRWQKKHSLLAQIQSYERKK
jgi:hypothetical protein